MTNCTKKPKIVSICQIHQMGTLIEAICVIVAGVEVVNNLKLSKDRFVETYDIE